MRIDKNCKTLALKIKAGFKPTLSSPIKDAKDEVTKTTC